MIVNVRIGKRRKNVCPTLRVEAGHLEGLIALLRVMSTGTITKQHDSLTYSVVFSQADEAKADRQHAGMGE